MHSNYYKNPLSVIGIIVFSLCNAFYPNHAFSQEWNSLRSYQKETGFNLLQEGCWLKGDRKQQTLVWKQANLFNLSIENGNQKYQSISQIRDFYIWFDAERKKQGHEILGVGIAAIAAKQLSKLDSGFIRFFVVRNHEVVEFANKGSHKVFEFGFPLMKDVYFLDELITGKNAKNWSLKYGKIEQCEILEPLYKQLSTKALSRLEKMARGKGIFNLGVPKRLKYVGNIEDCQTRFEHGLYKLKPYYLQRSE